MPQRLLLFSAISILLCSCAVLPPLLPQAPFLSEKKECQFGFNSQNIIGANGNVAYAISDHFGLKANGSLKTQGKRSASTYDLAKGIEVGAGFFSKIRNSDVWVLEMYGGGGIGNLDIKELPHSYFVPDFSDNNGFNYFQAAYKNYFGQLAIGFKGDERADFITAGLGIKADYINFNNVTIDNNKSVALNGIFLKPFWLLQFGWEKFKIQLEGCAAMAPKKLVQHDGFSSSDFMVGVGVNYYWRPSVKPKR